MVSVKSDEMRPSTWNNTNQHWVPQFLLKGFGLKGKASRVFELDKETGRICRRRVAEVASKPRLLTARDDELLKDIEHLTAPVVDKIRKTNLKITKAERRGLDLLVAAMMQNDPYSGFNREETRQKVIEETSQTVANAFLFSGVRVNPQDVEEIVDEHLNHDYLTLALEQEENLILTALARMGLTVHYHHGPESFIIGDSPVQVVRDSTGEPANLLNPGSQVILPVGSRCMLAYLWATPMNLIEGGNLADTEQVLSINRDYYHESSSRFIYGRTIESLKKSRMMRLQWMPRTRSPDVADGWVAMQSELKRKEAEDRDENVINNIGLIGATRQAVDHWREQMEPDGKPEFP